MNNNNNNINDRHKEILKEYIEKDKNENNYPHVCISDIHYLAQFDNKYLEENIKNLFRKIKNEPVKSPLRKQLTNLYLETLDREYNDQTVRDPNLKPDKVGIQIDKVTTFGLSRMGEWASGQSFKIFDWVWCGTGTADVLFGDDSLETPLSQINVIQDDGFIDANDNGWTINGQFPRTTPSGVIAEMGSADTGIESTATFFDRAVFSVDDRITHTQNRDSFTLTSIYVLTSV